MTKNIIGIILGLFGIPLFFSALNNRYYVLGPNYFQIILPIIGVVLLFIASKLINLKEIENSPLAKFSFSVNQIILFFIIFILIVFVSIIVLVYWYTKSTSQ